MIPSAFDEAGGPVFARPALRLCLFGGLEVEGRGRPLPELARQPRTGALLAFLALHPFRAFSRSALAETLWPDLAPEQAQGALRAALYRLRRLFRGLRFPLRVDRARIAFAPSTPWWTDVHAFAGLLQRARGAPPLQARAALEAAVALYTGDLLPDWEAPWVVGWRQALREQFLEALARLWRLAEEMGDLPEAERWAERLFREEPTRVEVVRFLIRQAEARGDLEAARRVGQRYQWACRSQGVPMDLDVAFAPPWRIRPPAPLGRLLQALETLAWEAPAFPVEPLRQALLEGLVQTAEEALARGAYREAAPWAVAALALLTPHTPVEWAWRARCAVDAVADFEGDRARQAANLRAMLRLARRMGDPTRRAETVARLSYLELQRGRPAAAERLLAAAEVALPLDPLHRALLRRLRGLTALRRGWFPAARGHLQTALAQLPEDAPAVHRAATLNGLAVALRHLGDYPGALRSLETAWALLEEDERCGLLGVRIRGNWTLFRGWAEGPSPAWEEEIEALYRRAEAERDLDAALWMAAGAARIYLRTGDPTACARWIDRLKTLWPIAGDGFEGPRAALVLALAARARGDVAEARRWGRRALQGSRRWGRDDLRLLAMALRRRWTPVARSEAERLLMRMGWEAWRVFWEETPFLEPPAWMAPRSEALTAAPPPASRCPPTDTAAPRSAWAD